MKQKSNASFPHRVRLEARAANLTGFAGEPHLANAVVAGLGSALGIAVLTGLGQLVHQPLLVAPFCVTAALAFALPDSPRSRPRAIVGGHIVAASVGLLCLALIGDGFFAYGHHTFVSSRGYSQAWW